MAVRKVGLNQQKEVEKEWFGGRLNEYSMFQQRLDILKKEMR